MIVALAGGVGGAKLVHGLAQAQAPEDLSVVVNTADDFVHLGLHISPDLDTVMYTLAQINNRDQGWGIEGESWNCMRALERLGAETWFRLGDQDLATHLERSTRLRRGDTLSAIAADFCRRLGIKHKVIPMSDQPVSTVVHTQMGALAFQDYFVRLKAEPPVIRLEFAGAAAARLSEGFRQALEHPSLTAVVICPSNPYLSIGPILALADVRDRLTRRRAAAIAVSPIVGGKALKGPAAKIMRELGNVPSALEVAKFYRGLIDGFVLDVEDAAQCDAVAALGIRPRATATIMRTDADRLALASEVLEFAELLRRSPP
jgi:LPPG:FO 2-phospho-L-lactate transferase